MHNYTTLQAAAVEAQAGPGDGHTDRLPSVQ
jgi:hypothetical protein